MLQRQILESRVLDPRLSALNNVVASMAGTSGDDGISIAGGGKHADPSHANQIRQETRGEARSG